MRSCETTVRYKSVGAPTTFVTHSSFTGTHGRYVKLETEDDATLPRLLRTFTHLLAWKILAGIEPPPQRESNPVLYGNRTRSTQDLTRTFY